VRIQAVQESDKGEKMEARCSEPLSHQSVTQLSKTDGSIGFLQHSYNSYKMGGTDKLQ
jgi:hypothetical protein